MSPAEEAIERLIAVFGEPKTPSPERFLDEYRKALTGLEARILDGAVDRIIKRSTFWPKPAEIIEEANTIAAAVYRHQSTNWDAVEADRKRGWSPDDLAKHNEFMDQWRRIMSSNVTAKDDADTKEFAKVQREPFEEMQRNSPNRGLHRRAPQTGQLTERSRRMSGDDA